MTVDVTRGELAARLLSQHWPSCDMERGADMLARYDRGEFSEQSIIGACIRETLRDVDLILANYILRKRN